MKEKTAFLLIVSLLLFIIIFGISIIIFTNQETIYPKIDCDNLKELLLLNLTPNNYYIIENSLFGFEWSFERRISIHHTKLIYIKECLE